MKYKTKPIDYTGCHPVIAEHLKRGEAIYCEVWDDTKDELERHLIASYILGDEFPYRTTSGGPWEHAEPISIQKRIKKASEIIKWCEENGWEIDAEGNWVAPQESQEAQKLLFTEMLRDCGKLYDDSVFCWREEWLEEV